MDFIAVVDQVITLLHQRSRVTYRTLQRQFALDDDTLADLKEALLYASPVVEDGRGLVWTGAPVPPESAQPHGTAQERRFHALVPEVLACLQRDRRVTYRRLIDIFGLDEALLAAIRDELTFRRLAIDEEGRGLVWTGESLPAAHLAMALSRPPALTDTTACPAPEALSLLAAVPEPRMPSHEPTGPGEAISAEASQDEPAVTPGSLRRVPDAERRQLTVMFCDLADSTRLAQQLDPEDLRDVVRAYQETAAAVIHPYAGHIAQYLGDGLLIYFGWPVAHEDDAQRAVHAGLGIVEALTTTLNPRLARETGVQLTVRLGVHTGAVVVGQMGGGDRHEHLATGDTVNIAARLEGVAAPNTVVLSAVTARLVESAFALDDLGPQTLKGIATPLRLFRVRGPLAVGEDDVAPTLAPGALVGRDEEVGLLRRRWEQAKTGLGQVVLLSGEAGIGKSALVDTVRAQVRREGHPCIVYRCSPYYVNSVLYPVLQHLQRFLGFDPEDRPDVKLDKLEQVLRPYQFPRQDGVPLLADLLDIPLPAGRYAPSLRRGQQQRQQTQDALAAWLLEEADRQPLLVVWEDVHWVDPSTLDLLSALVDQTPTAAILHVVTSRPEFVPPWPARGHLTPITLNRLERPQVEVLILRLTGGKTLPPEVVEHIVAKTDGVPLFVEELTKMLVESALLRKETARYVLTGPLAGVAIPVSLYDSLMARLDRLPAVREVAQLGAVLGREFAYEMLHAVMEIDEPTLRDRLTQLVATELLYQRGRPPHARYLFKHALVQDAAYASLLTRTRQRHHRRIAEVLEARFPTTVEREPELVAHHYTEAGDAAQAWGYWYQAGQRAMQRSANVEAIAHLRQGIALLTALPDTPARVQAELTLQTTLGPALMATRGYAAPEVAVAYNRARELCQQAEDTPELFPMLWGLWLLYLARAEHETARELGEQCLSLAQRLDDPALLLEAHFALGANWFYLGQLSQAHAHLEQGIHIYDPQQHHALAFRHGNVDPGVVCLAVAGWTLWLLGYPDQALERANEALTLAQNLEHPYTLARGLYYTTLVHQLRREWQMVSERAETAITVATAQQVALVLAVATVMRGWALAMQGQRAEGLTQLRQGLEAYRATGAEFQRPHFLGMLAEVHRSMGQPEAGLTVLSEAMALVETTGERYYEAELHRLQGELLLHGASPDLPQAEACFQQALAIARRQEAKALELRAATSLARLWQAQGKRQEAHALLAPIYGWFTEGFDTVALLEAKALLEELQA